MSAGGRRPTANGPAPAALESERWRRFREWCEAVIREQGTGDREPAQGEKAS